MDLHRRSSRLLAWAVIGLVLPGTGALGQSPERGRGPGFDRGREGSGQPRFNVLDERFNPTPEQLDRIYQRMTERYLERFEQVYQLDDEQREKVRQRLERLRSQQVAVGSRYREEAIDLVRERQQLYVDQQSGQAVDEQRLAEVNGRLETLRRRSPLFNFEEVIEEVESLLPPEQVELGGLNRERWRGQWQEGFGASRVDGWDRYVERFVQTYQLDASQRSAAESLARNLKEQRDTYREANRAKIEAVQHVEDRQERQRQLRELNQPIDRLFGELREKLMQIPTTAQKLAAEATTRPAATAPDGPSTRPATADFGDRSRPRRAER